jgi:DNA helicase II / ATP-dependent DNA helicase PcrA
VADEVQKLIDASIDPNEIAVFYRVNSMSRAIEEAFVQRQLPYQVVRGVEFYSRKEVRDLLSYLKLMVNPDDNIAFERAVGTHSRGIGKTSARTAGAVCTHPGAVAACRPLCGPTRSRRSTARRVSG